MKKRKAGARQSESRGGEGSGKNGPVVLVPLLSKREAEPAFIEAIAGNAHEIILLLVIDTSAMGGRFGFATNEIAGGNALMQRIKALLRKKKKICNDVIEWGDTATKIGHLAQLHSVDSVFLVLQDNLYFQNLVKALREKLPDTKIEAVQMPGWK